MEPRKIFKSRYVSEEIAQMMVDFAKYVQTLPPQKTWQVARSRLTEDDAATFELKWKLIGYQLSAYYSDRDPLPLEKLTEPWQQFVKVWTNYYSQLGLLVFQALPQIKEKFASGIGSQLGIQYPFERRSDLLKEIILEDCLQNIELMVRDFWESPSEKEAQRLWQICIDYYNQRARVGGIVKPLKKLTSKEWAQLYQQISRIRQKLNWSDIEIDPILNFWNALCEEVFEENREKLPAYNAWVDAREQKFAVEKWKKYAWKEGKRIYYPGRGKSKTTKS